MAKIKRRKIETNYTVVENDFLRDRELGLTERGMLMTMLSLPDDWDYSAKGLASILPDGKKKTNNSLQRLEQAGYLKRSRIYENGKVVDWLYEFCEQPIFKEENLLAQKGKVEKNLVTPFVQVEKVQVEKVEVEKGSDNKRTKELNTKELNTVFNQSINLNAPEALKGKAPKKIDRLIDTDTLNDIKDQIQYDVLLENFSADLIDTAVSCIADLYCATEPQTFNERTYSVEMVHRRSLEIEREHLEYVFECFQEQRDKVYNVRKYLLTSIFNAPDTMGAYYENAVRAVGML